MADTVVEATMDIVRDLGGSGEPDTVIEALVLLREVIGRVVDRVAPRYYIDKVEVDGHEQLVVVDSGQLDS